MLQACLNGNRSPREHHHLPVLPADLAHAAALSVAAGATDIHLHPKTADGADSLDARTVADTLRAVRAAAPGIPIGITTGAWTASDPSERINAVRTWTVLPDHASVNWHEPGADDVAAALLDRGIDIEAGLWSGTGAEQHFLTSPVRDQALRILAEITDLTAQGALRTAEAFLNRLPSGTAPILLHGQAAGTWPVLTLAGQRNLATRIGLEDTLQLPDGTIADDNATLVASATQLLRHPTGP